MVLWNSHQVQSISKVNLDNIGGGGGGEGGGGGGEEGGGEEDMV